MICGICERSNDKTKYFEEHKVNMVFKQFMYKDDSYIINKYIGTRKVLYFELKSFSRNKDICRYHGKFTSIRDAINCAKSISNGDFDLRA
ncbi:MAG: hypothetical protein ACRCX2_34035 [Paraclostridium sp.]